MHKHKTLTKTMAALLLAGLPLAAAHASDGDGWSWKLAPMYVWAPSVSTDLEAATPPLPTTTSDSSFSDIISKVDIVFTAHLEGQGDRFGVMSDVSYLALSDEQQHTAFETEASMDMTVFELAGVWAPGANRFEGFEGFAGLRYLNSKVDAKFEPVNPLLPDARRILDKSFTDFLIGGRYTGKVSDRWDFTLRGDASFGDTDGTYNVSALFKWHRSDRGAWAFGYKYMHLKFDTAVEHVEVSEYGPVIGYEFNL